MVLFSELKTYHLTDRGNFIGEVHYNSEFNYTVSLTRPFVRNGARTLVSIGRVNYELLDQFIIQSLNDYYAKIMQIKDRDEMIRCINEYQQLFYLWQVIVQAKQNHDGNLNNYYDDLVYRMYLLGYRN